MRREARRCLLAGAVLLLLVNERVFTQSRAAGADVRGTVRDATGAAIAGSTIAVTNLDTDRTREAVVDDRGLYVVAALAPGSYAVRAAAPGFRSQTIDPVVVTIGDTLAIDFVLQVAAAPERVTVSAAGSISAISRVTVGSTITQEQIRSLPTNGRDFIAFAALVPGVSPDHTPSQGAAATSGLSFMGQRGRSNNITIDGFDNNDPVVGAVRATFSQDAVREFQVLANSFSAEFGKASGGIINIVTNSGTNVFHGRTFVFARDRALNAAGYFERHDVFGKSVSIAKPRFRQGQWGGVAGGPVRRSHTFHFLSYEGSHMTDGRLVAIDADAATLLIGAGFPLELGSVPYHVANTELLGKIDHHWSPTRALVARASFANIEREGYDDFGGIVGRSRASVQRRTDWSVAAAETSIVSARWFNELRGQYAHLDQAITALDPTCRGSCTDVDDGGPTVEVTGVAAVGRNRFTPSQRLNRRLQFVDTVSYFRRSHHVKFGADYNFLFFPSRGNVFSSHFGGRFIFSAIPGLGIASSLDGLRSGVPLTYVQAYGSPHYPDERYSDLSLFVQDEYQLGRLSLRLGLRYQRQFWQDAAFTVSNVGGTTFSYPMPRDRRCCFAPRTGVAYDLTGGGRTIAHGAYGVFHDSMITLIENAGRFTTSGSARAYALSAPLASTAWSAPGHRLTEQAVTSLIGDAAASVTTTPGPSLRTPFSRHVSLGITHELSRAFVLSVNAIHVHGRHLPGALDYNPLLPSRLGPGRRPNDEPCARHAAAPCINGFIPGSSSSVIQFTSFGESWYHGVTAEARLSRAPRALVASYTLSKAQDTSTDFQSAFVPQHNGYGRNPDDLAGWPIGFDPGRERGPSTQDRRHRLVISGTTEMPGRLQLSMILNAASGRPFTPLAGADLNGDGNGGQFPSDRARRDPADESTSVPRNSQTTASTVTVDVRLTRPFALTRRATLEAIVEAFNLFNRANFIEDSNQSSFVIFGSGPFPATPLPAYGRYTVTLPPRQVQLAARLSF